MALKSAIQRRELPLDEAVRFSKSRKECLGWSFLDEIGRKGETVSLYSLGDFADLCRGPHVPSSGYLRHTALLSVAGAYWRGDENNPMLTRVYGTAFESAEALKAHMEMLEEARRRDHRKLGPELGLFTMGGPGGPGLAYWLPKGGMLRDQLERFWKDAHVRAGYRLVVTPHIAPAELWKTSGHYDYYRENMYFTEVEKGEYAIKPMNCPVNHHHKSERLLPIPLRLRAGHSTAANARAPRPYRFTVTTHIFCFHRMVGASSFPQFLNSSGSATTSSVPERPRQHGALRGRPRGVGPGGEGHGPGTR